MFRGADHPTRWTPKLDSGIRGHKWLLLRKEIGRRCGGRGAATSEAILGAITQQPQFAPGLTVQGCTSSISGNAGSSHMTFPHRACREGGRRRVSAESRCREGAEGPGLEPGRGFPRRFSRPLPCQLGLALRALKRNDLGDRWVPQLRFLCH